MAARTSKHAFWFAVLALCVGLGCSDETGDGTGGTGGTPSAGGTGGTSGGGTGGSGATGGSGGGAGGPESGWTEFSPSADTTVIYVSSSEGDDSNDGLSEAEPVATLTHGVSLLRDGFPDWLLLKKGDRWDETFGTWDKSGRSQTEPMVIGSYSDGDRPYVNLVDRNGIFTYGTRVSHLAITHLHFHRDDADPALSGNPQMGDEQAAIYWLSDGEDILIEGNEFGFTAVAFNPVTGTGSVDGLAFRRNVVRDNYGVADGFHAQGFYASNVVGLLIEENVMDHNGWHETIAGADPTIYNHNFYLQFPTFDVELRGNLIARGSSHGAQMRNSGIAEQNVFVGNSIAVFQHINELSHGPQLQHFNDNAIVECGMQQLHPDNAARGWGLNVSDIADAAETIIHDNVVAHCPNGANAWEVDSGADESGNVIYDWGGTSDPGPFSDPTCTVGSYHATIGGAATLEAFLDEARRMEKGNYRTEYTAAALVAYFQGCFSPP